MVHREQHFAPHKEEDVEKANEEDIHIAEANQIYDELWEGSTWHRQKQPDTEKQEGRAGQQVGGYAHTDRQTEGTRTCNNLQQYL